MEVNGFVLRLVLFEILHCLPFCHIFQILFLRYYSYQRLKNSSFLADTNYFRNVLFTEIGTLTGKSMVLRTVFFSFDKGFQINPIFPR